MRSNSLTYNYLINATNLKMKQKQINYDKKEIYLDLSKLSEVERKQLIKFLLNNNEKVHKDDLISLKKGKIYDKYCPFLSIDDNLEWVGYSHFGKYLCLRHKQEVNYGQFKTLINE